MKLFEIAAAGWFTPESVKKDTKPPKFKVRGLTGIEQSYASQHFEFKSDKVFISPEGIKSYLEMGLIEWKNIEDKDGKPLKYHIELLNLLPHQIGEEISNEILRRTQLGEPERKN